MVRHYQLKCPTCGTTLEDDGFILDCPTMHEPSLLNTGYMIKELTPYAFAAGIQRYRNWLPCLGDVCGTGQTVTYRSERLNRIIGLPNLWMAFNGYWPERGATLETTTFKELEAYAVLARVPKTPDRVLVVASAGNTAAAFAHSCSQAHQPCLIVIPEQGLQRMIFQHPLSPCVKVVCLSGNATYSDAIAFAERVSQMEGFFPEGGVKNVGRRDGIGTTMLSAVETIGRLPDYYFQGVGSGTGAIAAHEAAKRLIGDGRFGHVLPRLILSQNSPFAPLYHSWKSGRREPLEVDPEIEKMQLQQIVADVLSNQRPPYAVRGGVYDVLKESLGDMCVANNVETLQAMNLFQEYEGVDIDPAAGVALATLITAVTSGQLEREALVLLHITGGRHKHSPDKRQVVVGPDFQINESEILASKTMERVVNLFG